MAGKYSKQIKFSISTCVLLLFGAVFCCCTRSQSESQSSIKTSTPATTAALIATMDGSVKLVDCATARVIWSLSTGSPLYQSYHLPTNVSSAGFIDLGEDDWDLVRHDVHFRQTRISDRMIDFISKTPIRAKPNEDVVHGFKITSFYDIDLKTGTLFLNYTINPGEPMNLPHRVPPLYLLKIFRNDHTLRAYHDGQLLWSLQVAEIKAILLCHYELPEYEDQEEEQELDFVIPSPFWCGHRQALHVYRQRNTSDLLSNALLSSSHC